jgi:hypothetical protein
MTTVQGFFGISTDTSVYGVETPKLDLGEPEPCMPPPATLPQGDIGAELASLIVVSANQNKAAAHQLQKAEEAMQDAAEKRQIAAMHREAELKMAAGVLGIVGNAVEGTCMAIGGLSSGGGSGASGAGNGSGPGGWSKGGGIAKGLAEGVGGVLSAEAVYKQADADQFEHEADAAKRGASASKDSVDDAKKLADKAIDFYQQWTQGKAGASQAALHRS